MTSNKQTAAQIHDWVPCELHTHTVHSDAKHTLSEMAEAARHLGLQCLAITDHNTMSGLAEQHEVEASTGLRILEGMEITTFYGHILALGVNRDSFIEWRDLGPGDIEKAIERVHGAGGIIGAAHPFLPADPITIGCRWVYTVPDWSRIDYLEVWNEPLPSLNGHNRKAMRFWDELLNQGVRIAAICGRDWHVSHSSESKKEIAAATYIRLDQADRASWQEDVLHEVRTGRASISMGRVLDLHVWQEQGLEPEQEQQQIPAQSPDQRWLGTGEVCRLAENRLLHFQVSVTPSKLNQELPVTWQRVRIVSSLGTLVDLEASEESQQYAVTLPGAGVEGLKWARAELYGLFGETEAVIGFTNCIYFDI